MSVEELKQIYQKRKEIERKIQDECAEIKKKYRKDLEEIQAQCPHDSFYKWKKVHSEMIVGYVTRYERWCYTCNKKETRETPPETNEKIEEEYHHNPITF
jgi:hypothetical protein